jgi:hypothetical protein
MKMTFAIGVAVLAAAVLSPTGKSAFAQSDRTLGINCTVAGHERCGETGPIGRRSYGWRHRRHRYNAYASAGNCRVIRQRVETPSGRMIYRSRQVCR